MRLVHVYYHISEGTEIPLQEITELENFEEEDLPDVTTLVGSNITVNFKS